MPRRPNDVRPGICGTHGCSWQYVVAVVSTRESDRRTDKCHAAGAVLDDKLTEREARLCFASSRMWVSGRWARFDARAVALFWHSNCDDTAAM
jgi:hypothetical protein